ncbi:MAG: hypothetical protein JXQ97_06950 [Natronospirillum sp.]
MGLCEQFGMSGAEFLAAAAKAQPDAYRVLLTGYSDISSTIAAVNEGRIHRYVAKPWVNDQLIAVVDEGVAMSRLADENKRLTAKVARQNKQLRAFNESLEERVAVRTQQLGKAIKKLKRVNDSVQTSYSATLSVLYNIININPAVDGRQAHLVSGLCKIIGEELGLEGERLENLALSGLLSQIGVLGLEHEVAIKPILQMSTAERARFYTHPQIARTILSPAQHLDPICTILEAQYERFSGAGLPKGLQGSSIPLEARIVSVARDFCAALKEGGGLTDTSTKEAKKIIRLGRGTVYDPDLVDRVLKIDIKELLNVDKDENTRTLDELEPGMVLDEDIFNLADMLLLKSGTVLTPKSIDKLRDFEQSHDQVLHVRVLPQVVITEDDAGD